jgi:uncharacterized protein (TIGR00369 family)
VELIERMQARTKGLMGETLGVRFVEVMPNRVVAELEVHDGLCTTPGIMHGGAIIAFADELGGTATGINLPPGAGTTTIESKTNFFAPGRSGETVRAECLPLHRGKRTMVWQTRVTSSQGRLLALVTQTQIVLEPTRTPQQIIGSLFDGKTADEQRALLAQLERGGAAIYRAMAAAEPDQGDRAALLSAAEREEENAELLERHP